MNEAWQPIYSIDRSGITEVTVFGAISVVEGRSDGKRLAGEVLALGDTSFELWTRSLLKPWQLLSHLDVLKQSYPKLRPDHITLMMASHSAEPLHQALLHEIMEIGHVTEDALQCPAAFPHDAELRRQLKKEGASPRRLYHNCSGKHLGYILAIQAEGGNPAEYLDRDAPHFKPLIATVCSVLHRPGTPLPVTTDGCQMPNYAITIREIAQLYHALANAERHHNDDTALWHGSAELCGLMRKHPNIIGGTDRLDTQIMSGSIALDGNPAIIAKEGADGLLGIGVGSCAKYPDGLGILIKLSSGFDAARMSLIAGEIFAQLGLRKHDVAIPDQPKGTRTDHLSINYHFRVNARQYA